MVSDQTEAHAVLRSAMLERFPYQQAGVEWMLSKEERRDAGGILADEMGMGKTIQAIGLILARRSSTPNTLIVCPLSTLAQWEHELLRFTKDVQDLKIHRFYGPGKILHKGLRKYDVVLTTYEVMKSNLKNCMIARNALCGLTWDRIVLDEAHRIRNQKTKLHLAALTLEGRFRWCLTGTPLQNRASDLEALLGFIGIGDYDPIKLHNNMLRRTSQASTCLNEPIHWIDLSGEERPEYDALWEISIAEIEELIREGELRRNYPRILAIVLRLRQWLDHPSLPAPFQKYARCPL
jgi:SNF2 family DNA or RNA helicase